MREYTHIKTDILVVGGGMAALFAAIKAKENGSKVVVVDKGYAGKSGQSPYADAFTFIPPDSGYDVEMQRICKTGEYLNNREWAEICFQEGYNRYQDLFHMGVEFFKDENEQPLLIKGPTSGQMQLANIKGIKSTVTIRKYAEKIGITFYDKVMITELVKPENRVIGAVGITVVDAKMMVFGAKAVILCTGASGYKPVGWPIHGLTSDGDVMAYRVGAEITGKEFTDLHNGMQPHPMYMNFKEKYSNTKTQPPFVSGAGADGTPVKGIGTLFLEKEFQIHKGNGPVKMTLRDGSVIEAAGGTSNGMSAHKSDGIWPLDTTCETTVSGLYAAGDALGNMHAGATYPGGLALSGSAVTGARAGKNASEKSKQHSLCEIKPTMLEQIEKRIFEPLDRVGGHSPKWVIEVFKNMMLPYFVTYIKEQKRMEAVLTLIEFMRDDLAPKIKANDGHELRLALEAKNMIFSAEMKLRASLERKESRGTHYREDYPARNDENGLAWHTFKDVDGKMTCTKYPVPKEWRPNPSAGDEKNYLFTFPTKDTALKLHI